MTERVRPGISLSIFQTSILTTLGHFSLSLSLRRPLVGDWRLAGLSSSFGPLNISGIGDVHGYFFTKVLGDFFQGQTSCFGEEEVDDCWMLVSCCRFGREER